MKLVLLSGGSGQRLWPLSNDARSKQFLKVLEGQNGTLQSMVQRVWKQLRDAQLADCAVIATSKSQVDMIQSQLDQNIELVIEPNRRDTFPAIALAASYVYSEQMADLNEVVVVLPVDLFVQEKFFDSVKELERIVEESHAQIALIGVKPTHPSSKYGYIVPAEKENHTYFNVNHFIEKPPSDIAQQLIDNGSLWNCGVFAFRLHFIIQLLEERGLPTNYQQLMNHYETLPKISFDYEVVEKSERVVVLPYNGYWKDLGTWNTLTEQMDTAQIGKGIMSEESKNTHLINELDIPITILGVSNAIVAASPDGILVADKEISPRLKELVGQFEYRPMYEERRWGSYRVLDYTKTDEGQEVLTKRIKIKAGCNLSYQYHFKRSEIWTIIRGEGVFVHNDQFSVVRPGDVVKINMRDTHALKAVTDLEIIEVQSGTELIEEDIVRVYMTWEEVEKHCYPLMKH